MFAWQATVQDERGNAVVNPSVTVYLADGLTLASVYDEAGNAKANPFAGTLEGFVQFWARHGEYVVTASDGSGLTQDWHVYIGGGEVLLSEFGGFPGDADVLDSLNNASLAAVSRGMPLRLDAGVYLISARWTMPEGLVVRGAGIDSTVVRLTNYDRVSVMSGVDVSGITFDAANLRVGSSELSAIQVGSNVKGRDIRATGAYSNFAFDGENSTLWNVVTDGAESRGVIFGLNSRFNKIIGLNSFNNGNSGVIFGQGANNNHVYFASIKEINSNAIWFSDGAFENLVSGGTISSPRNPLTNALAFGSSCRDNVVRGMFISGYRRGIIATSGPVVVGPVPSGNLVGNIVENCEFYGLGADQNTHHAVTFGRADASLVNGFTVRDCLFSGFYGLFENNNSAVANVVLSGIRTRDMGAASSIVSMKGASGSAVISDVQGYLMKRRFTSPSFPIDSTGTKTVVIPHTLGYTPPMAAMSVNLQRISTVTDFRIDHMWVVAVSGTDITVRAQVGSASSTVGATAAMSVQLDMEAENGFSLVSINNAN